jgi:hypothetical protein
VNKVFLFKATVKAKLQKIYNTTKRRKNFLAVQRMEGFANYDVACKVILQIADELKIKLEE